MTIKGRTHRCDIVNLFFFKKKERILNRILTIYTKLKRGRYLHLEIVAVNALSALLFNICIEYVIRKDQINGYELNFNGAHQMII
jgi:hypothetical protein